MTHIPLLELFLQPRELVLGLIELRVDPLVALPPRLTFLHSLGQSGDLLGEVA